MIELFDSADAVVTPVYFLLWKRFGVDEAMIERKFEESLRATEVRHSDH